MLVAYSPNNGGTCWAASDNDGSASPLGGAPAGTEYTQWKYSTTNPCSTGTGELRGRRFHPAPTGITWGTSYPTAAPAAF